LGDEIPERLDFQPQSRRFQFGLAKLLEVMTQFFAQIND
jgi:hypothetical protein